MPKNTTADTIRELEAGIQWLREQAADKLADLQKAHPEMADVELLEHYNAEAARALDGLNVETVALIAKRSFDELRRKRTGFDPDHAGGA